SPASRRGGWAGKVDAPKITALADVRVDAQARASTGIGEFDRVLGGGLAEGALVPAGGDPGTGNASALLQAVAPLPAAVTGLYVTGEESLAQRAGRAQRLGLPLAGLQARAETCVGRALEHAVQAKPRLLVADSIQTLWTET